MNHPNRDEWVPYVFGEGTTEARRSLRQHLDACPECRHEVELWQRSLSRLNAWKLPRNRTAVGGLIPGMAWAPLAGALALLLAVAFWAGRTTSASSLRAEFAQTLEQRLAQNAADTLAAANQKSRAMLQSYAESVEASRAEELRDLYATMISLKKDVDTVALNTDASLRFAEQQWTRVVDAGSPSQRDTSPSDSTLNN